jgi:hypothetical protein
VREREREVESMAKVSKLNEIKIKEGECGNKLRISADVIKK